MVISITDAVAFMKNQNPALEQGSPKPYGAHTHSLIWSINSK